MIKKKYLFVVTILLISMFCGCTENRKAKLAYKKAHDYERNGNPEMALESLNEAIRLNPKYAEAYCYRGYLSFIDRGANISSELENYNEAIRLKPKYAAAYMSRGMLFFFNENYNEALADINSALKYYPKSKHDDFLFEMRGTSNYMVGNFYDAIDDFSRRIKKSPFVEDSYISRGRAYRKIYDYEKAIADFSKAIMIKPESTEAYKFRGLSYFELGDYDKAIADYSELIRLRQQYYAIRSTFQYVDLSDPYRGIMHNERIKLAYIYYHRGDAYYGNGDTENANSDYSEANKIAPFVCGCNVVKLARDWDCDVNEFFRYWLRKSELKEIMERK